MEHLEPRLERMLPLGIFAQLSPRTYTYIWWDDPVLRLALNVMGRAIHVEIVPTRTHTCLSLELNARLFGKAIFELDMYRIINFPKRYRLATSGFGIWTPLFNLHVSTKKHALHKRTFGGYLEFCQRLLIAVDHPA